MFLCLHLTPCLAGTCVTEILLNHMSALRSYEMNCKFPVNARIRNASRVKYFVFFCGLVVLFFNVISMYNHINHVKFKCFFV